MLCRIMFVRNIIKAGLFFPRKSFLNFQRIYLFSKEPKTEGSFYKFDIKINYYKVMEIEKDATIDDINKAYGRLYAKYEHDQDKGPGSRIEDLNQAYRILSNPRIRKKYNEERFISRFDQKMQEAYEGKTVNLYPEELSPEQQNYYERFNKRLKYFLMAITAIAIFSPFVFWRGGQVENNNIVDPNDPYPKRHRGGYLNREGWPNQNQQNQQGQGYYQGPNQAQTPYQGPYPGQGSKQGQYPPQQTLGMNPPGVQVIGQFVDD